MSYFARRRIRKSAEDILRQVRHVLNMNEDIMPDDRVASLRALEQGLADTIRSATNAETIERKAMETVEALKTLAPPRKMSSVQEHVEIFVVAVAVAMGFRTYFIQPFKIPTGSMQPTLFGITSVDLAKPGFFDHLPLKPFKWFVTGEWYHEIRVSHGGELSPPRDAGPRYPTDYIFTVFGKRYRIPRDAFDMATGRLISSGYAVGDMVPAGAVLWSGCRIAGDHVFVNKIAWNVRKPRRGEVMVFSTRGIPGLQVDFHYIKRMAGLPGETISVDPPRLLVDGQPVTEPRYIKRIEDQAPGYAGYQVVGNMGGVLRTPADSITLNEHQYFALGDNTLNSRDGRYWGAVPEKNLVGPAVSVYWPFTRRGGKGRWGLNCWH